MQRAMFGAVMISAGFVHLLGTAIKELDPLKRFPLAPFLCGLGFLVTLVADQVASMLSERNGWHGTAVGHCHAPSLDADMSLLQHVLVVDPAHPLRSPGDCSLPCLCSPLCLAWDGVVQVSRRNCSTFQFLG